MKLREGDAAKKKRLPPMRLMSSSRKSPSIAVAHRRQTYEEQRQFSAAIDGFLAELVRQHLGPRE